MRLLDSKGQILQIVYIADDRFLEDLPDYVKNNFNQKPASRTDELLDRVFAHISHWDLNCDDEDLMAKLIFEKIKSNGTLQLVTRLKQPIPELLIYEFNGTTTFGTFRCDDIVPDEKYENFTVPTSNGYELVFSKSELDEIGGEANPPESELDEAEFYWPSDIVHFFMKSSDEEKMRSYLSKCIVELNLIYNALRLETIAVVE
jgi:hypothetical protein